MKNHKTILLVDDDPDDVLLMTTAITGIDPLISILTFDNGSSLLRSLQQQDLAQVSMIILDMNMPIMNGVDTVAALRQHPDYVKTPAVMLSTSADHSFIEEAFSAGIDCYFTKPNSFDELVDIVRKMLTRFL